MRGDGFVRPSTGRHHEPAPRLVAGTDPWLQWTDAHGVRNDEAVRWFDKIGQLLRDQRPIRAAALISHATQPATSVSETALDKLGGDSRAQTDTTPGTGPRQALRCSSTLGLVAVKTTRIPHASPIESVSRPLESLSGSVFDNEVFLTMRNRSFAETLVWENGLVRSLGCCPPRGRRP